jgi:hypothetical protein
MAWVEGEEMRNLNLIVAGIALSGLAGCAAAAPKPDLTPVTSSPLPSMQQYNGDVGKDYWVVSDFFLLCDGPTSVNCSKFLEPGTHFKVDGLVPNHSEIAGVSTDMPYFHVVMDNGRSGFVSASLTGTATVDPKVTAAECKKKGDPRLGMNAAQVAATCWGPPSYVNTKIRKTGKYEQYVYGDNKFVYLRNGVVTSISVKGRSPKAAYSGH